MQHITNRYILALKGIISHIVLINKFVLPIIISLIKEVEKVSKTKYSLFIIILFHLFFSKVVFHSIMWFETLSSAISHSFKRKIQFVWTRHFPEKHFKMMLKWLQEAHFLNIKRHSCCRSVGEGFKLFIMTWK